MPRVGQTGAGVDQPKNWFRTCPKCGMIAYVKPEHGFSETKHCPTDGTKLVAWERKAVKFVKFISKKTAKKAAKKGVKQ